jgi:hypothetical protein
MMETEHLEEQLPPSSYTPVEVEQLDGRELRAWLDSIERRLEGIKRHFAALYGETGAP